MSDKMKPDGGRQASPRMTPHTQTVLRVLMGYGSDLGDRHMVRTEGLYGLELTRRTVSGPGTTDSVRLGRALLGAGRAGRAGDAAPSPLLQDHHQRRGPGRRGPCRRGQCQAGPRRAGYRSLSAQAGGGPLMGDVEPEDDCTSNPWLRRFIEEQIPVRFVPESHRHAVVYEPIHILEVRVETHSRSLPGILEALDAFRKACADPWVPDCEIVSDGLNSVQAGLLARSLNALAQGKGVLEAAAVLLPRAIRRDWLEEQRCSLVEIPTRRSQAIWVVSTLRGFPCMVFVARTSRLFRRSTA